MLSSISRNLLVLKNPLPLGMGSFSLRHVEIARMKGMVLHLGAPLTPGIKQWLLG